MEGISTVEEMYEYLYGTASGQTGTNNLFPFVPASELTAEPIVIDWLLQDVIEKGSLNLLFGEPGAGKSLFALDWAFCLASGLEWHGRRVKQTDVMIIAGEGFAGMARRLKALEAKYDTSSPNNLYISKRPGQLLEADNAAWIAESISALSQKPGLIIIDTLHRNMHGDENSSQDIGTFIGNLDTHLKPLGCAVLVVHHSGHGQKDRSRGSSSIRAAMDGEFSSSRDQAGGLVLTCHKAKDFEAFTPMSFSLEKVELDWLDEYDQPQTSVYLEYQGEAIQFHARNPELSARDEAILQSLRDAIDQYGKDSETGRRVHIDYWRMEAYKKMDGNSDSKRQSFHRSRKKLFEMGLFLDFGDDYFSVTMRDNA